MSSLRKACPLLVALLAAGCSSSSSGSSDAASPEDTSRPDRSAPKHDAKHDGAREAAADGAGDAATVCSPLFGVDAGKHRDAEPDARHRDAGADGQVDGESDAPRAVDATPAVDAAAGDASSKDAGVDAPPPSCMQQCIDAHRAAYEAFERYQVSECGCVADGECYSACHASTTLAPSSACGTCLAAQTAEGLSSECTLAAAHDCAEDMACTAYQSCAGACPM
jgi:hypothetical protein